VQAMMDPRNGRRRIVCQLGFARWVVCFCKGPSESTEFLDEDQLKVCIKAARN